MGSVQHLVVRMMILPNMMLMVMTSWWAVYNKVMMVMMPTSHFCSISLSFPERARSSAWWSYLCAFQIKHDRIFQVNIYTYAHGGDDLDHK